MSSNVASDTGRGFPSPGYPTDDETRPEQALCVITRDTPVLHLEE